MPNTGPNTPAHPEWLGFIQPNGMAVSAPALVKAGAILNRQDTEGQARLAGCVEEREFSPVRGAEPCLQDFRGFATAVLDCGFSPKGCADTKQTPGPDELGVPRPDYCETLGTDFAVRERAPRYGSPPWQLLVQVLGRRTGVRPGADRRPRTGSVSPVPRGPPVARRRDSRR